ncbi:uncharacterized protein LOC132202553 [Neocloeon triangulifer]|uniref:uncharacterized protein LOC132202553 n=1 Tax=Neocloeon triangulifer TaxID=2078957 RepID=UPI00286F86B6|nr:uncharacterized protein LOC132202553 [Neocloeon triangulifer]
MRHSGADRRTMRTTLIAAAAMVLGFACVVLSLPQRGVDNRGERPFVDQFREYYPDYRKFFHNYTFGDNSKRVFFRSGSAFTRENPIKNKQPAQYISDIDDGYHYEKPKKRGPLPYKVHFNLHNGRNNNAY